MFIELFVMPIDEADASHAMRRLIALDDIGEISPSTATSRCTIFLKTSKCWIQVLENFRDIWNTLHERDLIITITE